MYSNHMWKRNPQEQEFHVKRCNRTEIERGVERALNILSKFSIVLTDVNKEDWAHHLLQALGIKNKTLFGDIKGRSNSLERKGSNGLYEYENIPPSIMDRIKKENALDIALYHGWLKKHLNKS